MNLYKKLIKKKDELIEAHLHLVTQIYVSSPMQQNLWASNPSFLCGGGIV